MATYAAVLSLIHVMENIKTYRLQYPMFLDEQKIQLESLNKTVTLLLDFLETYSSEQAANDDQNLETRIADAAYVAEDVIETYIVDYLHAMYGNKRNVDVDYLGDVSYTEEAGNVDESTTSNARMSSNEFSLELQKVVENMDFLVEEVMEIKESNQFKVQQVRDLVHADAVSIKPLPTSRNRASVELFRDEMNEIVDKLTRGQTNLFTCSVVGMGGTGKTTLARLIYENKSVVHRFDIRGWVTVSQTFKLRELLVGLLRDTNAPYLDVSPDDHQLGDKLYKHLFGRRYLVVLDDVWDVEALDKLKLFLPDNHNGSRIVVTTRISNVATQSSFIHRMNFLDERKSWELFSDLLFGEEGCPHELKEIAEIIAGNCKGLLLALSVLGGLLANSNITREYLEYIAQDTMSFVNTNNEDHCLKILLTSYNNLPVHLKPCFLYFGCYEEDDIIGVAMLTILWVSEGLLKPSKVKSMEEVANDYLKDLIGRNLILVTEFEPTGEVKYCKMHDLVRDLCLREAYKDRFLYVTKTDKAAAISQGFDGHRRVVVHSSDTNWQNSVKIDSGYSQSPAFPRSLQIRPFECDLLDPPFDLKLLRVLSTNGCDIFSDGKFKGINLRFIHTSDYKFPSSIHSFWNLQVLSSTHKGYRTVAAPPEIWEIPQLSHVMFPAGGFYLSDPLVEKMDGEDDIVLENLQEIGTVIDFKCTEEFLRKFPNIKTLGVTYYHGSKILSTICLENLGRLQKLETLGCSFNSREDLSNPKLLRTLEFPLTLKDLMLYGLNSSWKNIVEKIGSLPHLEKLMLIGCDFEEWETVEGQFPNLKSLTLVCLSLVSWKTDSEHFPCLEHLQLEVLKELEEIPCEIGEIQTLRSINLIGCNKSVTDSAIQILEEQRSFCNEDLILIINGARACLG